MRTKREMPPTAPASTGGDGSIVPGAASWAPRERGGAPGEGTDSQSQETAAAYAGLAVATIAVSFSAIFISLSSAPPLVIASYRMAMATVLLLAVGRGHVLGDVRKLDRRDRWLLVASGVSLALHFGLWTASLKETSVASSVLFVTLHPAIVAALAWALFGERLAASRVAGLLLSLAGSVVIAAGDLRLGGTALWGDLLAVGGAAVFTAYLLIGRTVRQRLHVASYSTAVYAVCTVVLALLSLATREGLAPGRPQDVALYAALAVVCTLGGHSVYNWTLRYLRAAVVAVSFLGEPVIAALLAWLLLGQRVPGLTLLGGAVVLAGVYLTARPGR
jgi:drug/metabolite transporter (DMT)-like permease